MSQATLLYGGARHLEQVELAREVVSFGYYDVPVLVRRRPQSFARHDPHYTLPPPTWTPEFKRHTYVPVPLVVWMERGLAKRRGLIR